MKSSFFSLERKHAQILKDFHTKHDEGDIAEIEKNIVLFCAEDIFKLSECDLEFKQFCQRDDLPHTKKWIKRLKAAGYFGEDIISIDKKDKCSTYDQFITVYLFTQFRENKLPQEAFNKSCELGFHAALLERCKTYADKPKEGEARAQFDNDIKRLCNLYWSIGHLYSCAFLLKTGDIHEAIKHFLCAEKLDNDHPYSAQLMATITQGNMGALFGANLNTWSKGRVYLFREYLHNDNVAYERLDRAAKDFVKTSLSPAEFKKQP